MPLRIFIKRSKFNRCLTRLKVKSIGMKITPHPPTHKKLFKNLSKNVCGAHSDGELWAMCDCNLYKDYGSQMLIANKGTHFLNKIFFNIHCGYSWIICVRHLSFYICQYRNLTQRQCKTSYFAVCGVLLHSTVLSVRRIPKFRRDILPHLYWGKRWFSLANLESQDGAYRNCGIMKYDTL